MKYVVLTLALMLLLAAPAKAMPPGTAPGPLLFAEKDDDKKDKPVFVIKGKGGKVTKVKKPRKKK